MKMYFIKFLSIFLYVTIISNYSFSQGWTIRKSFGTTVGNDRASSVAVDSVGNVYVTGSYTGSINFGTGALTAAGTTSGQTDGFIAKFNPAGVCQWAVRVNGPSNSSLEQGLGIATNGTYVYVGGVFQTSVSVNGGTAISGYGGYDGFVTKLSASSGSVQWTNVLGGIGQDGVQALCIDTSGNAYVSGYFSGTGTFGTFSRTVNGTGTDMFTAKINGTNGTFAWASTGGATGFNDNSANSGVAYVPGLDAIVMTGSVLSTGSTTATYATTSPASSVSVSATGGADIVVLKMSASTGAFQYATSVGGASSSYEEGLAATYDRYSQKVCITGYLNTSALTFSGNTVPAYGTDDIFYACFDPSANVFSWARSAGSTAVDRGFNLCADGAGNVFITGRYRLTMSAPTSSTPLTVTSTRTNNDEIFLLQVNSSDGLATNLVTSNGDNTSSIGNYATSVAVGVTGNIWLGGAYGGNITFSPLAVQAASSSATADVILARYDLTTLGATQSQKNPCGFNCNGTASLNVSGGQPPYIYSWAPEASTGPTATNMCLGSYTVTITDFLGTQITKTFTMPATQPSMATTSTNDTTFTISSSSAMTIDSSCHIIVALQSGGASPASGTVVSKVWVENTVQQYANNVPFVQRHYQITPSTNAATATGTVTLFFSQAEFNNFNAAPGSTLKLPTGPSDAAGISNIKVAKFAGVSNNNTGLPSSYSIPPVIIDPNDGNITWNASASRWEVKFDVTGFSGFMLQTSLNALPLNLLSLNGQSDNGQVKLNWKTDGEADNSKFEIERSTDGINFNTIGQLASRFDAGTATYNWTDASPETNTTGKVFYRIKTTSVAGKVSYSSIINVTLGKNLAFMSTVLPNPFRDVLTLELNLPQRGTVSVTVSDMTGRRLSESTLPAEAGFTAVTVKGTEKLKKGSYLLSINYLDKRIVQKVIKE